MTTETNGNGTSTAGTIMDRALACELTIGRLGIKRKVKSDRVKVMADGAQQTIGPQLPDGSSLAADQPDGGSIMVTKRILDCPEYHAIESLDGQTRTLIESRGVPSMMRRGVYLIPDELIDQVDRMIITYKERRAELVDAFLAVYANEAENARANLGALYDATDYPPASRVREAFIVRHRWVAFGVPGRMQSVSGDIYRREQQRIRAELESAAQEIRDAMRQTFADLIGHMVDRLTPGPDGKPRIFRDSLIENLSTFLETFAARNIAGDAELAQLVNQARDVLNGTNPDAIRREPITRQTVAAGVQSIAARLDTMIKTTGRRFSFDQEGGGTHASAA